MKISRVWLTTGFCIFLLLFMVQCQMPGSPARRQQAPVQQIQPQDNNPVQQQDDNPIQQQDDNPIQQQDNPQPAADFQLEGIWEAQVETDYGTVYSELILEHTRTFSQQVVLGDLMT